MAVTHCVPRSFQQEVVGNAGFSGEKAQTPRRNDRTIWEIWACNALAQLIPEPKALSGSLRSIYETLGLQVAIFAMADLAIREVNQEIPAELPMMSLDAETLAAQFAAVFPEADDDGQAQAVT